VVRLAEPIDFPSEEGIRPTTDFLVIWGRLGGGERFMPRGSLADQIVLDMVPTRFLRHLLEGPVVAIAGVLPERDPSEAELWASLATDVELLSLESRLQHRNMVARTNPRRVAPLAPALRAGLLAEGVRELENEDELIAYAKDVAETIEEELQ
jgi:hypothetical protein